MPHTDWAALFTFTVSPLELAVRGSAIYWFLFLIFRTVVQRDLGSFATTDMLVLVIIADASQNAMAGEYKSIVDGMVLIGVIIGWNVLLDWLCYVSPRVAALIRPPALCLIQDGQVLRRNLRRELISMDELRAKVREHGIDDFAEVRRAYLEADGSISVLQREEGKRG